MYKISLRNTVTNAPVMPEATVDEEGLEVILKRVLFILIGARETFIADLHDGNKWRIEQARRSDAPYELTAQKVKPS